MPRPREGSVKWNKKRKSWQARLEWTDDGGRTRCRRRQVENKTAGNSLIKQWLRELEEQGAAYLDAERMTFKELAEKYRDQRLVAPSYRAGKKVKGLRDWKEQRRRLDKLTEHFGKMPIRAITYASIERYRNELLDTPVVVKKKGGAVTRDRSIGDVHRMLSLLRTVLKFAVQSEWLERNPFSKGESLISMSQEVARERVLSTDEQRRLLTACQTTRRRHVYPLILVALDSGCRRGELLKLTWADVDLDRGALKVISMNAKTNRERVIDLEPITMVELRKMAKESGGFAGDLVFGIKASFDRAWRAAMVDAEITGARFHDLRATAITHWLLRGMSVPFAMNRSGHSDPRMFMRYVRMCEDIQKKQREHLREWDLASSLAELAGDDGDLIEVERSELVN
jgi:integrase